jgi:hypothetical protein
MNDNIPLTKSTMNADHVTILVRGSNKSLMMIANPVQNLISYAVSFTQGDKEGVCSIKDLDRAINFYNKIK